ncbi:hypothetical protein HOLleu_41365 [Holothuria leucospilota]|uniref:Uncharacterized protein n=1 Tax=Holothuria leucospilota TaxID=206669 RepID=A0A9Q1B9M4_HOLLE|nr:hypothetical protein HOLleu_41365 [Holothuria leucospilota]
MGQSRAGLTNLRTADRMRPANKKFSAAKEKNLVVFPKPFFSSNVEANIQILKNQYIIGGGVGSTPSPSIASSTEAKNCSYPPFGITDANNVGASKRILKNQNIIEAGESSEKTNYHAENDAHEEKNFECTIRDKGNTAEDQEAPTCAGVTKLSREGGEFN